MLGPKRSHWKKFKTRCAKLLNSDVDPVTRLRENELLSSALLRCHRTGLVEFHSVVNRTLLLPSLSIRGFPPYRDGRQHMVSLSAVWYTMWSMFNEFDRLVMTLLDGSKDYAELETRLVEHVLRGDIVLHQNGEAVTQRQIIATVVQHSLAQSLKKFAQLNCLN